MSICHPEATALSSPKDPGAPREASRTLRGNNSRVRRASKSEAQRARPEPDRLRGRLHHPSRPLVHPPRPRHHPPPRTHLPVPTSQGPQIRALPGSLAPAAVNLPHPVIPTGAKRQRAQWRDLAFGRSSHKNVTTITDASRTQQRKTRARKHKVPRLRIELRCAALNAPLGMTVNC